MTNKRDLSSAFSQPEGSGLLTDVDPTPASVDAIGSMYPSHQESVSTKQSIKIRLKHPIVGFALLVSVALFLRLYEITNAYNIFIDEVTYSQIAINTASGHGITLYGSPFDLHPPIVFLTLALVIQLFHLSAPLEILLLSLRPVFAVFGSLIVGMAYLLMRKLNVRPVLAFLGAALLAIDPFAIYFDSRVLLEAETQAFVIAAVLLIAIASVRPFARSRRVLIISAGIFSALAMTSKETFGLVVGLLLLALLATKWVIKRSEAALIIVISMLGVGTWVLVTASTSGFASLWKAQTQGFQRLIGTKQITGFNSGLTHVTLVSRVLAELSSFGVTYAILAIGGIAAISLLWILRPWTNHPEPLSSTNDQIAVLVVLWTLASGAYLVYATLIGSLEEQMYYIPLLPCLISMIIAANRFSKSKPFSIQAIVTMFLALGIAYNGTVWFQVHTVPDNTYAKFFAWERSHIAGGTNIDATESVAQFMLQNVVISDWSTIHQLSGYDVDYVLLQTNLVAQGYGTATPKFEAYLNAHEKIVFQAKNRSGGYLRLYDVEKIGGGL